MTTGAWAATQPRRSLPQQRAHDEWRRISGRRGTIIDWTLLVLAAVSVGLNAWFLFGPQPPYAGSRADWHDALLVADLAICVVFLVAICIQWLRFRIGRMYLSRHWWEIPALVPFVVPWVGDHHWVMWILLAARGARLADRTDNIFGDRFTAALVKHFADPIVDAIKRPITVAVLDEVNEVLRMGTYAENIRRAVAENRAEIEAMVLELVREDHTTRRLRFVPFHDDIVRSSTDTVLRIVDGALDDPRTTELISDVIRTSVAQIQLAVRERR
jgi:voltage-gated potassium channel